MLPVAKSFLCYMKCVDHYGNFIRFHFKEHFIDLVKFRCFPIIMERLAKTKLQNTLVNVACISQVVCTAIIIHLGYEPADLTVHPPPKTIEGGFFFFRIGV